MRRIPRQASEPMRFTSLKLKSWKNFKEVDIPLAERVFIIGPNASGKSNFLEVFRFLHDLTTEGGGLAKAVSLREGMSKLRSLHATVNSAVEITVGMKEPSGATWKYQLVFDTPSTTSTDVLIKVETVERDGNTLLTRPSRDDEADPDRLRQTAIEQVAANKDFRQVAELFRSIRFMNLVPQLIREGQSSPQQFPGQDPLGRDLLEQIRQCKRGLRSSRLKAIERVLRSVVPNFEELRLETDSRGRPHLAVGFKHWRTNAVRQRESQFSDGTLRLIAMLWALQEDAGPLLLEEPEWSLHTGILERLAAFIARMQREGSGRQVFITTHSERVLADAGIAPEELLLILPARRGGSEIQPAARYPVVEKAMRSGLTAAEAAQPLTRVETMRLFGEPA
ncbi:MAG: AAA family ATPase [Phycisphaerae bacterium]|nr:AAA family ATPase [Phycisphaerae bacterium]